MQNNVKGLFKKIAEESGETNEDSEEEEVDAFIEGPNKENNEMSVNIKINKKNLFNKQPQVSQ